MGKELETKKVELPEAAKVSKVRYSATNRVTAVSFADGSKITVGCKEGDTFDVQVGVALAVAYKAFGSKTRFHKVLALKGKMVDLDKPKTRKLSYAELEAKVHTLEAENEALRNPKCDCKECGCKKHHKHHKEGK